MELTDDDVREILRLIDESDLDELRIEVSGLFLHVRKGGGPPVAGPSAGTPPAALITPPADSAAALATPAEQAAEHPVAEGAALLRSPMLGTFYRAEAPGERPFVQVGDHVDAHSVVCLIEVMKLMNHIPAGMSGTVTEVLAENGTLVEFEQPLFRLAPAQ